MCVCVRRKKKAVAPGTRELAIDQEHTEEPVGWGPCLEIGFFEVKRYHLANWIMKRPWVLSGTGESARRQAQL